MNNQNIISFSIDELREKNPTVQGIHYNGCFIALPEHQTQAELLFDYPCRINAHFIMICTEGSATVNINLNKYRLHKNSVLLHRPNNILQIDPQNKVTGYVIGFDKHLFQHLGINTHGTTLPILQLLNETVLEISPEESRKLQELIRDIANEIVAKRESPYFKEILRTYFQLLIYKLCDSIDKERWENHAETSARSRNEIYFRKFMHELELHYKSERSVGFYASQLCITPKYLTTLIKKVSGHSAAEWIDRYVILEAQNLLLYSSMSIQEVAYYLNFPNQSFFGKYFKHQTGMSPSAYKMQRKVSTGPRPAESGE